MNKSIQLNHLTVAELVERFLSTTLAQYEADLRFQISKYNQLYRYMNDIRAELKRRDGDQRRALLPLLNYDNAQVRLMTASTLLVVAPELAKKALITVRDSQILPQSANAGMLLDGLEDGSFVPQ